ncbi:glutamate synthase large subunit [Geomesophilobacter sediminis]|uniref:Glutamate synthase [NADPH] large chain n=1 Tax=Geomesophilobacter sediminis TaxID=2798584 RepID=A0A8J7LVH1_9BACT|nr:glutamate synthase large subunit [Geomesophilobacter sediminis]MBJ6725020.1 glutamate synthase large subunit [Geomesophilobacter sediminis]
MTPTHVPKQQGLFNPRAEHAACGVGFVAQLDGTPSHRIVSQGLEMLANLNHRGACGCEHNTGDGAGILLQLPDRFLREQFRPAAGPLPPPGDYAVAMVFASPDPARRATCCAALERAAAAEGLEPLGWRDTPTDNSYLGKGARSAEPVMRQCFLGRGRFAPGLDFERRLYLARKRTDAELRRTGYDPYWYVASMSSRTLVYKGMLTPAQLTRYYPDLSDPALESALALVHSRFSTNTFPAWHRAHPYRLLAHNGEINTLRGNVNWMQAREGRLEAPWLLGKYTGAGLGRVIDEEGSDSAMLDNCLELLLMAGRSLPHAMLMMVPEAWENNEEIPAELKAFYRYHATLMEPWDGPAALVCTDGRYVGAILDRNGLRPLRYCLTCDGLVVLGSEAGALPIEPERIVAKGRVHPGQLFLADLAQGRIVDDDEIKSRLAAEKPYRQWLDAQQVTLEELADPPPSRPAAPPLLQLQIAFGYNYEELRLILEPMARTGQQPLGSMAVDTPLAALSGQPQLLYDFFRQHFAQVTNPPIDPIREKIVTATETYLGARGNLLAAVPDPARLVRLRHPIMTDPELERLRHIKEPGFKVATLPALYRSNLAPTPLRRGLEALFEAALTAVKEGCNILVLSDRGVDRNHLPIPALLAVSGLHHHLIREGARTETSLVVESGEPREVHHFALLIGYGADAVNPYLALRSVQELQREGFLPGMDPVQAQRNYRAASLKGVVKTMAKMGISTAQGYRGAQIFEAIGLDQALVERYFTGTPSRVGGMRLPEIAAEVAQRHRAAFAPRQWVPETLPSGGIYQWRADGTEHQFTPRSIHLLQQAVRAGDYAQFRLFSELTDAWTRRATLRGLLNFAKGAPIPIEKVEPVSSIVQRFKTGAMSYGSISKEAHETLAIAMNRLGGKSNTGEGGEDPVRFADAPGGDSRNSAIKQVASGRFGVTSHYLSNATEIQIKMAQGAKPGEGGELPGGKVFPEIARTRHTTPGVGLISPPPHHDIYSIEDLAQLIRDLKCANRRARISVKLVSRSGVGTIAAGVAKAKADVILISGCDGGTGASPLSSIRHAGLPWEIGLAEAHQTLLANGLRDRVVLETDGQLRTGRDVAIAALLGAEEFGFATGPLVALGCLMMRVCHQNTCPAGIATQDPELRRRFTGKPEHVVRYLEYVARELREIMAGLGVASLADLVGRGDLLEVDADAAAAAGIDLSPILFRPRHPAAEPDGTKGQDHGLEDSLDLTTLLDLCRPALESGASVRHELEIRNVDRTVGTILGNEITLRYGAAGLPEDTISLCFRGSAGQSFGAFLPAGVTLELEGEANDYLAKGLSGGKIIVYPPKGSRFAAAENIITGNVAGYGATGGEIYVSGAAGERFCVRNSGATAVVEAAGDHCCEYMTGGTVLVLGPVGRNFAAGMSGGVAYVLDPSGELARRAGSHLAVIRPVAPEDAALLKELLERQRRSTGSSRAAEILAAWQHHLPLFTKVVPKEYQRVLEAREAALKKGLEGDAALEAAFRASLGGAN